MSSAERHAREQCLKENLELLEAIPASEPPAKEGAELLNDVQAFIQRFVVLTPAQAAVLALFVLYTYTANQFECAPYVQITSAEKRSGKSRLLEVLELLVSRPWMTSRTSAAALVRRLNDGIHCLLLDESDAAFGGDKEYSEALRGVLNAGHRKGGKASLCTGKATDIKVVDLEVFGPKVIAGIGKLPDTVADRAIPIPLQRKAPGESVERFRPRVVSPSAILLRSRLAAWANCDRLKSLAAAWPELPASLSDRQQDVSEPLLAVADLAAGDWPALGRSSLAELFGGKAAEDESIGVRLLSDTREVFDAGGRERLSSVDLVAALLEFEGSPWPEFNHGKPLTPAALARLLRKYDISPRPVRTGSEVFKGYQKRFFEDAWNRYLAPRIALTGTQAVTELQPAKTLGEALFSIGYTIPLVTAEKSEEKPVNTRLVTDVTAKNPLQATQSTAEDERGVAALVQARLRMGLSVSPELRKKYATGGVEI